VTSAINAFPVTSGESFALHKVRTSWDGTDGDIVTTVEQSRGTRTEATEIMPFGGWESTPATVFDDDQETLFRFPAPDDPAPEPARLLAMALYSAVLGLAGVGVGVRAIVTVFGGTAFWYVPALCVFGLLSVTLVVGSFLSIHRPALPWTLLGAATMTLAVDVLLASVF
jgi:hypothetical protein